MKTQQLLSPDMLSCLCKVSQHGSRLLIYHPRPTSTHSLNLKSLMPVQCAQLPRVTLICSCSKLLQSIQSNNNLQFGLCVILEIYFLSQSQLCFFFIQLFTLFAPKASAEGACILGEMGYCYCYCYCYYYCYCYCYSYYYCYCYCYDGVSAGIWVIHLEGCQIWVQDGHAF